MRLILFSVLANFILVTNAQKVKTDSLLTALETSSGIEKATILNTLSWEYKSTNLDSCRLFAQSALVEAEKLSESKAQAIGAAYNSLANFFEAAGKMDSSEFYGLAALKVNMEVGDSIGIANAMNSLGIIYDLIDSNEKSLDYYLKALRIYERHSDDPFKVAMVNSNIGIVLKKLKEFDQAVKYYENARIIYERENSDFGKTVTEGNIGAIFINLGKYEKAVSYSEKARDGYSALGYHRYIPYSIHNIAIALDSLHLYNEAERNYNESIEKHLQFGNRFEVAAAQNALASMLIKQARHQEAKIQAQEALSNAIKVKSYRFAAISKKTLAKAEAGLGNYKSAMRLFSQYVVSQDSLHEVEKTEQIFELQTKYETEKKEKQIALQVHQLDQQKSEIEKNKILVTAMGSSIFLLFLIGILLRNSMLLKREKLIEKEKANTRQAQVKAALNSQETERKRFARDLHDSFGQMISVLNLNLKSLEKDNTNREEIFENSSQVLDEMYKELKGICFNLMPETLIKSGVIDAIKEFAFRINKTGKIYLETDTFGIHERLSDLQEISIYRITQEWVNNVLKYSDADKVTVSLTKDEEELTLLIEDNGFGFDKNILINGSGNGWKNMNSRANLINGELEIDTTKGLKNNTLILIVPELEVITKPLIEEEIPS